MRRPAFQFITSPCTHGHFGHGPCCTISLLHRGNGLCQVEVAHDHYLSKVNQGSTSKGVQRDRNCESIFGSCNEPSRRTDSGSTQFLREKGENPSPARPGKMGRLYVTTGNGTEMCLRFSKCPSDACASPCQQGRAHACQWCVEPHSNEQCETDAEVAARTKVEWVPSRKLLVAHRARNELACCDTATTWENRVLSVLFCCGKFGHSCFFEPLAKTGRLVHPTSPAVSWDPSSCGSRERTSWTICVSPSF